MWKELLGSLTGPIADYFKEREITKQKERELQDAAHARLVEQVKHSEDLDQAITLAQISNSGWKDEWFTILFSIPLVGAFVPKVVPYVLAGFEALDKMPSWYKWYLGSAVTAAFGLKTMDRAWKWWNSP
jgi:hypothetical protein